MTDETQLAIATAPELTLGDMFRSITELATNPDVDPAKMSAIVDLQERMMDRQSKASFNKAMHQARKMMPRINKDGAITNKTGQVQSRFATYEAIDKIVRPLIEAEGLSYGFDFREGEQMRVLVTCIVSHVDGHEERFGPMPLSVDTTGAKNATQGAGSAGKYGQRYTLCAAFNIVTDNIDDDGTGRGRKAASSGPNFAGLQDAGQKAATQGSEKYADWFGSQTNMKKGWLVDEGHHADNKTAAANFD